MVYALGVHDSKFAAVPYPSIYGVIVSWWLVNYTTIVLAS